MGPSALTSLELRHRKGHAKIVMVTAYDVSFARALDAAGVDVLLVGDSLGMVVQGHANTLKVTVDHMVYHAAAVTRGAQRAHVLVDLPFLSYHTSVSQAVASAGRLVQEGGAHSVKLEGGEAFAPVVAGIVHAGIPVMGHVGLTPQRLHELGGFKVQGRNQAAAARLLRDARALQDAGAYALVLEAVPAEVAEEITARLHIPTIGIGAGAGCDGQVLVCYDLLGMNPTFVPKFVKGYDTFFARIQAAAQAFTQDIRDGNFPGPEHTYRSSGLRLVKDASADADRTYGGPN